MLINRLAIVIAAFLIASPSVLAENVYGIRYIRKPRSSDGWYDRHIEFGKFTTNNGIELLGSYKYYDGVLGYVNDFDPNYTEPVYSSLENKLYIFGQTESNRNELKYTTFDIESGTWSTPEVIDSELSVNSQNSEFYYPVRVIPRTDLATQSNVNSLASGLSKGIAMATAMTALPNYSANSQYECGIGVGQYSSEYAVSTGCSASINKRLSVNTALAFVSGGASTYGGSSDLDNFSTRLGFNIKLGKIEKQSDDTSSDIEALKKEIELLKSLVADLSKAQNK